MKFPSLASLRDATSATIRRFPLEFFFAVVGTCFGFLLIEFTGTDDFLENLLPKLIMVSNLGLALSFALSLYAENEELMRPTRILYYVFICLILFGSFLLFYPYQNAPLFLRFFLLTLTCHLLVSFLPFIRKRNLNGFWQYNKLLFLRICTSFLFSSVLYLGLCIAIGITQELFGLSIESKIYGYLLVLIAGIFNTLFFLGGIPVALRQLDVETSYPKSLKIFSQYVLIPLTSIYLVILLAYEIKIVLAWDLPKGSVAALILGYAVFGILATLLIFPVRNQEENSWIRWFSKSFYFLMLPLILLLVLSAWKRISDYGITEERYFLILLAVWLSFVTFYFLLGKSENIKVIPVSLCFFAMLSVYGPQSAFSVSKRSQEERLRQLIQNKSLKNRSSSIQNVSTYLVFNHGVESLQPFVKEDVKEIQTFFLKKHKRNSNYLSFQYDVLNDTKDSVLRVIDPSLDVEHKYVGYENSETFVNEQLGKLHLDQPGHIVEFNSQLSHWGKPISFRVKRDSITLKSGNDAEIIFLSRKDTVNWSMKNTLRNVLRSKVKYKREEGRFIVPSFLLADTIDLAGRPIHIRLEQVNHLSNRDNVKSTISYFTGYLIIPD